MHMAANPWLRSLRSAFRPATTVSGRVMPILASLALTVPGVLPTRLRAQAPAELGVEREYRSGLALFLGGTKPNALSLYRLRGRTDAVFGLSVGWRFGPWADRAPGAGAESEGNRDSGVRKPNRP